MKRIYFDNAATTPLNKHVYKAIKKTLKHNYGNPSSLHYEGRMASESIQKSRDIVAKCLGCDSDEIFFTSGASESNSWVAKCSRYKFIASSESHSSLNEFKNDSLQLEIYKSMIYNNYAKNILYSIPLINNETGEKEIIPDGLPILLHLDLTQALGKIKINLHSNNFIRFASASGHKIGALKGCGILYIKKEEQKYMKSLIDGHQENELRGGTENVLGIVSFGIAMEECYNMIDKNKRKVSNLLGHLYKKLIVNKNIKFINTSGNVMNLTFNHLNAQTAVQFFNKYGIAISAGSACNSGSDEPSKVLISKGYTKDNALKTIRISLSSSNNRREIKRFAKICKKIIDKYDV